MKILTYDYFNKIIVPGFIINDDKNLRIVETFNNFHEVMSDAKIEYFLSGSLGRSILTKKCFRTWGDIDILISLSFKDFLKTFSSSKLFSNSMWKIENPIQRKSSHNKIGRFRLISKETSVGIEIYITNLNNRKYQNNSYELNINNNIINISFDYFYAMNGKNKFYKDDMIFANNIKNSCK